MTELTATALAHAARLGLTDAPWTVRPHPEPRNRQHPWLWACDIDGCERAGNGVNAIDAHHTAASHYLNQHANQEDSP
jgi:hypothetical protein